MQNIIIEIQDGKHDADLDGVITAVRERRSLLAGRNAAKLAPGDTVTFSQTIRPTYLRGKTATVVKRNPKSVVVNCPDDISYGRFRNAKNVRCANDLIAEAGA